MKRKFNYNKIMGSLNVPRLSIFKSNKHLYIHLIDDFNQKIIYSFSSIKLNKLFLLFNTKPSLSCIAKIFGKFAAYTNILLNITLIKYDNKSYKYQGVVKTFIDSIIATNQEIFKK